LVFCMDGQKTLPKMARFRMKGRYRIKSQSYLDQKLPRPYALTPARVLYENNFDITATAPVQVLGIAKQGRCSGFKAFVVFGFPHRGRLWHARPRSPDGDTRLDGTRHPKGTRLCQPLTSERHRHKGQPRHHAPQQKLR